MSITDSYNWPSITDILGDYLKKSKYFLAIALLALYFFWVCEMRTLAWNGWKPVVFQKKRRLTK